VSESRSTNRCTFPCISGSVVFRSHCVLLRLNTLQFALLWQSTEVLLYSARIKRKQLLICRCLVLLASCVAVPAPIVAQLSETATTPILGVGHNYVMDLNEIVDPENGALSVRIAAPTPAERGLNLPLYAYLYDSKLDI
jgi:hypothetical protein